jgi:hypothetical protein
MKREILLASPCKIFGSFLCLKGRLSRLGRLGFLRICPLVVEAFLDLATVLDSEVVSFLFGAIIVSYVGGEDEDEEISLTF